MKDYFNQMQEEMVSLINENEVLLVYLNGEDSHFVRFNKASIRQAGYVQQAHLTVRLVCNGRQAGETIALSGHRLNDLDVIKQSIKSLRECLTFLPEDPYLNYNESLQSTCQETEDSEEDHKTRMAEILEVFRQDDFVGIWADGKVYRGFFNSLGQNNWMSERFFNLDYSLYYQADKAVKGSFSGRTWQEDEFNRKAKLSQETLELLKRGAMKLDRGVYRAYLAPSAVHEIMGILSWGGFSKRSIEHKESPLLKLVEGKRRFSELITLGENTGHGICADFDEFGFLKPKQLILVENGEFKNALVNARSAKEFNVAPTAANGSESPEALVMQGGSLEDDEILQALDTGIYINNLWYLNYSSRNDCQITGMTRFACFWVEKGKIVAPIEVMRFDDSLYDLLGNQLVGLSRSQDTSISVMTYSHRSTDMTILPGILVNQLHLTL